MYEKKKDKFKFLNSELKSMLNDNHFFALILDCFLIILIANRMKEWSVSPKGNYYQIVTKKGNLFFHVA